MAWLREEARVVYAVKYVSDEELPPGHDWALVRQGSNVWAFFKESAVCPRVLEQAWAGYRALEPRASGPVDERFERRHRFA
jgi:hypothetical protein